MERPDRNTATRDPDNARQSLYENLYALENEDDATDLPETLGANLHRVAFNAMQLRLGWLRGDVAAAAKAHRELCAALGVLELIAERVNRTVRSIRYNLELIPTFEALPPTPAALAAPNPAADVRAVIFTAAAEAAADVIREAVAAKVPADVVDRMGAAVIARAKAAHQALAPEPRADLGPLCPDCGGMGTARCDECDGTGRAVCQRCDGTLACGQCRGEGLEGDQTCSLCRGDGACVFCIGKGDRVCDCAGGRSGESCHGCLGRGYTRPGWAVDYMPPGSTEAA